MKEKTLPLSWRNLLTLWVFLILTIVLSACVGQAETLWLKSPGWSRAKLVSTTKVGDPVPITFDDAGNIYIFLVSADNEFPILCVIAYDKHAAMIWDRCYTEIELNVPSQPQIVWDGKALQLFWISDNKLYNAQVDTLGHLISPVALLSDEVAVETYDVTANTSGSIALWFAGAQEDPGLYALPLDDVADQPILIDAEGVNPDLQFDDAGTLHIIWAHIPPGTGDKSFFYAAYPDGEFQPDRASSIAGARIVGTTLLEGPTLGLDGHNAYIFWTLTYFSGLEAGQSKTFYVSFPHSQSGLVSPVQYLNVPFSSSLTYQPFHESSLNAGDRVLLGPGHPGSGSYTTLVATNSATEQELVIAFHARLEYLMRKTKSQISAVFLQDGVPTSYQQLSFTPSGSFYPAIHSDDEGQLYLTWLEKGELPGWIVYFASTAPEMEKNLSKLSSDDITRIVADTAFGLLTGALLIPIGFIWFVPSMIVLTLTSRLRGTTEGFTSIGAIVIFSLAMIVLWVTKLAILPGILEYVPFSAWIPSIPSWLHSPLRLIVPSLIGVLSLLVAWFYVQRKGNPSISVFMIIYSITDGILTMAIYGVFVFAYL
jgi:hypothetical protein